MTCSKVPRVMICTLLLHAVTSNGGTAPIKNEEELVAAIASGGAVQLARTQIVLSQPLTITRDTVIEARAGRATISGGNAVRLFEVAGDVKLTLIGLNLIDGRSTNGGAVYNDGGQLVIIDCRFLNNLTVGTEALAGARGTNGTTGVLSGRPSDGGSGGAGESARGGAIFNRGTLRVWSSTFENNLALASEGAPGGNGGDTPQSGAVGAGGDGGDGADADGGAVFSDGVAEFFSTSFRGNAVRSSAGGQGGSPGTNGISFYGARVWGNAGPSGSARGGAVFGRGTFRANDSLFISNQVVGADGRAGLAGHGGAAIAAWGADGRDGKNGGDAFGGAVFAAGQVFAEKTTFEQNSAMAGRGGEGGWGGVAVAGGHGGYPGGDGGTPGAGGSAQGGALAVMGDLTCMAIRVAENIVTAGSGGDGGSGGATAGSFLGQPPRARDGAAAGIGAGGGIFQSGGRFLLSQSQVNANVARAGGGGRGGRAGSGNYGSSNPSGFAGYAAPAGDASGAGLCALGTTEIRRTTLAFNVAFASTGSNGIAGLGSSKIGYSGTGGAPGGSATGGGAWFGNEAVLTESSLLGNQVVGGDGGNGGRGSHGMYTQSRGGSGGHGGRALGAGFHSEGAIVALNCTVAGNSAVTGNGGAGAGGDGQPYLYNEQPIDAAGSGGGVGVGSGGFSIATNSAAVFSYCTIASNSVVVGAGGFGPTNQFHPLGYWGSAGTNLGAIAALGSATFTACIVAGNGTVSASGNIADAGFNLCSDAGCGFTDPSSLVNTDPQLLPLSDNEGPTLTIALAATSPARDVVTQGSCPEVDQRGYLRPAGTACDSGAFELDAEPNHGFERGAITGRVTDGTAGIAGVRVRVGGHVVVTDENGEYRVDGLRPGRYLVRPQVPNIRFQPKFQRLRIVEDTTAPDFVVQRVYPRR